MTMTTKPTYVCGVGLWTPGYANPKSWCDGEADAEKPKPAATLLKGPLSRRATPLTRMSIEAMQQAVAMGDADLSTIPSVWATCHGEHSAAISLLRMMQEGEGKLSPTKFHNSVHNAASGYASIATGNRTLSTTLTGGAEIVASSLLEAICLVQSLDRSIVLVLADEPLLPPFERSDATTGLALSLLLSSNADGAFAALDGLRRGTVPPLEHTDYFGSLHVSAALPLIERIVKGRSGTVALDFKADSRKAVWCMDLEVLESFPTEL